METLAIIIFSVIGVAAIAAVVKERKTNSKRWSVVLNEQDRR